MIKNNKETSMERLQIWNERSNTSQTDEMKRVDT